MPLTGPRRIFCPWPGQAPGDSERAGAPAAFLCPAGHVGASALVIPAPTDCTDRPQRKRQLAWLQKRAVPPAPNREGLQDRSKGRSLRSRRRPWRFPPPFTAPPLRPSSPPPPPPPHLPPP